MAVFFPEKAVFLTHFMDLQDLRILRGPKMENRSPPGPKLCYLFQAGIPEIGHLRVSDPKFGQIDRVLTSFGGQNSLPQRGKCSLGPQILASLRSKSGSWVSDLGSQTLELASQRSNLASQRSKMTSERPKIGLPDPKIYPIFLILR